MKLKLSLLLLAASIGVWGCSKDDETEDDVLANVTTVVINEVMAQNSVTAADQDGEYDDWIELYNTTNAAIDLSGYYLSDTKNNTIKWSFPTGTSIDAKGYLIVWADKNDLQTGLHANFKLAAEGEVVVLTNPDQEIMDQITYEAQTEELSFARIPDGTGSFAWQTPTFEKTNGTNSTAK